MPYSVKTNRKLRAAIASQGLSLRLLDPSAPAVSKLAIQVLSDWSPKEGDWSCAATSMWATVRYGRLATSSSMFAKIASERLLSLSEYRCLIAASDARCASSRIPRLTSAMHALAPVGSDFIQLDLPPESR